LKLKTQKNKLAVIIGVHPSTISRELAAKAIKLTTTVIHVVDNKLQQDWSPEQISGGLKKENKTEISHERFYQHVWVDKRRKKK